LTELKETSAGVAAGTCPVRVAKKPVKVLITGAAGQLAYSAIFMTAAGQMLGPDQPVDLRLLDIPPMAKQLEGVAMELQDGCYPLLSSITATTDYKVAFEGVEVALLIGARPRGPGMQRKDLLQANAQIFAGQGKALNDYANRNVKVLVVGNPANTNALITIHNAPNIPKQNITAMTRLDQNRAQAMIAKRANVGNSQVKNVIIWGNHSKTQYPDVNHAVIVDHPASNSVVPVRSAVNDNEWLNGKFIEDVQDRGAVIIKAREKSSAASAAQAAVDHIRDWVLGTKEGEWVSMGVYSDGQYGAPTGVVYSFPCVCKNGQWKIVEGLKLDAFSVKKMKETGEELVDERSQALSK